MTAAAQHLVAVSKTLESITVSRDEVVALSDLIMHLRAFRSAQRAIDPSHPVAKYIEADMAGNAERLEEQIEAFSNLLFDRLDGE
jgi:hypothetical protein